MYVNNGSVEGDRNCEAHHLLWNDRIGVLKISLGVMDGVTESGGASEELEGTEIASLLPVGDRGRVPCWGSETGVLLVYFGVTDEHSIA